MFPVNTVNTYFEQHLRTAASLPERRPQDQWITEVVNFPLFLKKHSPQFS